MATLGRLLRGRFVLGLSVLLGLVLGVVAHERLRVNGNGPPLFWTSPSNIGIVIQSDGSDDIADGSHETALRMAIQDWNDVNGSTVALVEDTTPSEQARTDWASSSIHLVLFDEDNSSGFFSGSGTVAITPVWFFLNGQITDADILFNGEDFMFTTSGEAGRFDVQDVGAHELGHLLGLDHSGWAGATMYPYVDSTVILHRSLSEDDVRGMRDAYPASTFGTISGTIQRLADSSPVVGAHVVARTVAGRVAASALSDASGNFTIPGLDAGTYDVYADPLDVPVSDANLTAGHTIETDFETTTYGSQAVVPAGGNAAMGVLSVGADVALSLGSTFDNYPLRIIEGSTVAMSIRGSGLVPGSTLTCSDPDITLAAVTWFNSLVSFQVTVPGGELPGHVDLTVTNPGGDVNILTAPLEITPPTPTVSGIAPTTGSTSGGTAVTITGTNFEAGARVVLGDQIYRDGQPGGCTVVDATTITLTTLPTLVGTHDVVVLDATGVEGRAVSAFTAAALPTIDTVFPPSGDSLGGTEVILTGTNFAAGATVRIDGITQSNVTFDGPTRILVDTDAGVPGGPYTLEVENPGGALANALFTYVAQADPAPVAATPDSGPTAGGDTITITGADFPADTQVTFGVDPDTGAGGVPAASVTVVDANTLTVETPAHGAGTVAVLVSDASSGQAGVISAGFTFSAPAGGGGGGCSVAPLSGPRNDPRSVLLGAGWMGALALVLLARRRALHLAAARRDPLR